MRFIWANIISELDLGGQVVDFKLLNGELNADYNRNQYGALEYASLPRLVKTHCEYERRAYERNREYDRWR